MRMLLWIIIPLFLFGCTQEEPLFTSQSYVFGTLVDISIYGEPESEAQAISTKVLQQFQTLHTRLHAWKPSDLNGINRAFARGERKKISLEMASMLQEIQHLSQLSDGLFNPAIGALIQRWGFHQDQFTSTNIPKEDIDILVSQHPSMSDIVIKDGYVESHNPYVKLDMGGYAKGYALDQAYQIFKKSYVSNALINIGGNVIAIGKHGDKPWRVGIQHPRKPEPMAALDLPDGWAIGTSGDYQRYFILDNKRYCHIIDPRTGMPAQGTQATTVLIPPQNNAGVLSDVVSKPIFIADVSEKRHYAQRMGVQYFMVILENGKILVSRAMLDRLEWLDKNAKQHLEILD